MRNDIPFSEKSPKTDRGNGLVLVNGSDLNDGNQGAASSEQQTQATLITLMSVSIACAAAALATGSYAAWLARQKSARQALTDVNEILKSCQRRMQQLEADVERMPSR